VLRPEQCDQLNVGRAPERVYIAGQIVGHRAGIADQTDPPAGEQIQVLAANEASAE
jgi:hypothetical protein